MGIFDWKHWLVLLLVVLVLFGGKRLKSLGADLGESIRATPALVDGRIYLRTAGHLYAFAER